MPPLKTQTFGEHLDELRLRLVWALLTLVLFCAVGYYFHNLLLAILEKPLGQRLYYTSPIGGFNAIIKISVLAGFVAAMPVLIYQLCQFIAPAFGMSAKKRPVKVFFSSFILAIAGVGFGYFVSLPASLHFLTHIGATGIQPLLIANDYLNFAFSYLLGFALLFQLPLIIGFINNRSGPIKPGQLMRFQRWVILISFILAAILTPTPDPVNQLIMAMPIIVLYQFSIGIVWLQNKRRMTPQMSPAGAETEEIAEPPVSQVISPTGPRRVFMDIIPPAIVKSP